MPAFLSDGAAKDYVQHRIASHAMRVWRMLRAGAAVYVAGSAAKMPQDVRETMEKVVEACGGVSIDDARARTCAGWRTVDGTSWRRGEDRVCEELLQRALQGYSVTALLQILIQEKCARQ